MKHFHVTCAIIEREGLVLATQRSSTMSLPNKWEFPGGKIDPGETPEECLRRELLEELAIEVHVGAFLSKNTHDYPTFRITLYPFLCKLVSGEIVLHEHSAFRWLQPRRLSELDWAEADVPILEEYLLRHRDGDEC